MMFNIYKFVGVINLFNIYPDFLFPVYEKDNDLYFHNGSIDAIKEFDPLSESAKKRIVFLDNEKFNINNLLKKSNYSQFCSPVYAFQASEKDILCSDIDDMYVFLKNFKTDDEILIKSISLFVQEYTLKKFYDSLQYNTFLTETENNSFIEKRAYRHNLERLSSICASACKFNYGYENFIYADNSHLRQEVENKEFFAPALTYNFNHIYQSIYSNSMITLKRFEHSMGVLGTSRICLQDIIWSIYELSSIQNALKTIPTFRFNNQKKGADFSRLRLSFDYIIKFLSPMSEFYEICIKCQNSVINKDEDHLLQTINRHLRMFQAMQHKMLLDDYLVEYIQNHTKETGYIIIDEINNTQN